MSPPSLWVYLCNFDCLSVFHLQLNVCLILILTKYFPSIYLSNCLFLYISIYLSIPHKVRKSRVFGLAWHFEGKHSFYLLIYPSLTIDLSIIPIYFSIHLSNYQSIYLSIFIYKYIFLKSFYISVNLSM